MTIVRGGVLKEEIRGAIVRQISFSGTVEIDGSPAARSIKAYKVGSPETLFETVSASDGTWKLVIPGGTNDSFRIFCVGNDGENSVIYEHVTE